MDWREDCLWRIAQSGSSAAIVQELAHISGGLGFEYCSYVLRLPLPIAQPGVVWSSTYPSQWLEHYFSHKYLDVDPLLKRLALDSAPIAWSHRTFKTAPSFWEEARAHGIRHGWAAATHGGDCTTGMLSLARSQHSVTLKELGESEAQLVWLAQLAHGAISNIEMKKFRPAQGQELSHREREVLRWTAAGKTAGEVAKILGITDRTVNFHISSALRKLKVANKVQAAMTAMMLNMLF